MDINAFVETLSNTTVTVIGDVMLDAFVYGESRRLSPEAPVPVLLADHDTAMPGGAANAAANLAGLSVRAHMIGVVGNDETGRALRAGLQAGGVMHEGLIVDPSRPTTVKTRYISQDGHIVRVDTEKTYPVSDDIAAKLIAAAQDAIAQSGAVIISDYAKGVLRNDVIRAVIDAAKKKNIPVITDPKGTDYTKYQGTFAVTPNRKELAEITGMKADSDADVIAAARALIKSAGLENVVVKRSEDGITVVPQAGQPTHIKARAKEVREVSGAGDTVVATLAAALAAGQKLENAAQIACDAAGITVARAGTCLITSDDLRGQGAPGFISPVMKEWDEAAARVRAWQKQGFKVGFTNGCFDILHYGHVNYLNQARARCDKLIVGLNHDASVRILKGPSRPVNDEMARATVMAALGSVDMVVFFGAAEKGQDNTPCALIDAIRPDVFFKGGDYTIDKLPEAKIVQAYGGTVDIMPLYEGYSTTSIIEKTKSDKEKAA